MLEIRSSISLNLPESFRPFMAAQSGGREDCTITVHVSGMNDYAVNEGDITRRFRLSEGEYVVSTEAGGNADDVHIAIWWRCENGHSWRARIISRTNGNGCPICAGKSVQSGINDLSTMYPKIAEEWNTQRNGNLMPNMVTAYSNKKSMVAMQSGARMAGCNSGADNSEFSMPILRRETRIERV